jgi:hypothetical protein
MATTVVRDAAESAGSKKEHLVFERISGKKTTGCPLPQSL